jgi:hypothetical protein
MLEAVAMAGGQYLPRAAGVGYVVAMAGGWYLLMAADFGHVIVVRLRQ